MNHMTIGLIMGFRSSVRLRGEMAPGRTAAEPAPRGAMTTPEEDDRPINDEVAASGTPPLSTPTGRRAADALDELCLRLLECRLVLEALTHEIGVSTQTMKRNLLTAEALARQTREAISLIAQGAELADPRAGEVPLPRNIRTRHSAAVRRGAPLIQPEPTRLERLNPSLATVLAESNVHDRERTRRCLAPVQEAAVQCNGSALYLGDNRFANCRKHALETQIDRHLRFRASAAARAEATEAVIRKQVAYGQRLVDDWLDRRTMKQAWFEEAQANDDSR